MTKQLMFCIRHIGRSGLLAWTLLGLVGCRETTGPLSIGQPYALTLVNGQQLPFTLPANPPAPAAMIVYGSVTIINDSLAQRRERISESSDPSATPLSDWTFTARYHQLSGRLVLDYPDWAPGLGPRQPVETLSVSGHALLLREVGLGAPLDSLVRRYCVAALPC